MTKVALLVVTAAAALAAPQARPTVLGIAEPPELIVTGSAATTFAMTDAQYADLVAKNAAGSSVFVPIVKKPAALSPRARYGINLILRGKNLCWALDGDETAGYVLYADWNGNGDLTDDTPLGFDHGADGVYSLRVNREERDGDVAYPVPMRIVIRWVPRPGKTEKELALENYNRTTRGGVLQTANGRQIRFRLGGSAGFYDQPFHTVAFDLNGDGTFDPDTEIFRVSEKHVNIGDVSYEFSVDAHGRGLTLTPLSERLAARAALTVGSIAPAFSFADTAGNPHQLSDYRGKVVLLDFWGAWCAPCVAEAPKLVALYGKFHDRGLEILGLDTLDAPEKVSAFVSSHHMTWLQTIEPDRGPLQTLYRINGWPSYLLIDRDGTIRLAASGSNTDLDREVAALIR